MNLLGQLHDYLNQISDYTFDSHGLKNIFKPKIVKNELHISSLTNNNLVKLDFLGGQSYTVQLNNLESAIDSFDEIEQMYQAITNKLFFPITHVLRDIQNRLNTVNSQLQLLAKPELFNIDAINGYLYIHVIKSDTRFKLSHNPNGNNKKVEIHNNNNNENTAVEYVIKDFNDLKQLRFHLEK